MEENDIIALENEQRESFVLVERNKRRERARFLSYFKRGLVLLLLAGICFGVYKLFPHIKSVWSKMPWANSTQNTDTNTDNTPPIENNTTSPPPNQSISTDTKDVTGEYKINSVGTQNYKAVNESGCEFDFSTKYSSKALAEIYGKYGKEAPVVLITHSHIREAYSNGEYYSSDSEFYSDNENVADIGEVICSVLNECGINAIQINELYASGSIYGSQNEYEKAISDALKKYPSIAYVFNVSRGINISDDMTMNKTTVKNGESTCAQISITSGTSWDKATENQNNNVLFAFDFAKYANENINGIIKENKISRFSLSQDFGPIMSNLDIGEYSNSFDEAKSSAEEFAKLLSSYLKEA